MLQEYRNNYKNARRAAGLTQEAAAEKLGISVESIRAYENGLRVPPNDIVQLMCICYNAQHLAYLHLSDTNELMGRVVPQLEQRSLIESAVRIFNAVSRFAKGGNVDRLLQIAEDGQISQEEREDFERILSELRGITQSSLELEVFCGEGDA